jgi:hypothetical protein
VHGRPVVCALIARYPRRQQRRRGLPGRPNEARAARGREPVRRGPVPKSAWSREHRAGSNEAAPRRGVPHSRLARYDRVLAT